jgi:hypothetical protein
MLSCSFPLAIICQDKGIIPLSYSTHPKHKPFLMDFLALLLSNPRFLYSDNAYGFLFVLPEYSRMLLKLFSISSGRIPFGCCFIFSISFFTFGTVSISFFIL